MIKEDTICAISTPAGIGGIAVARVSGPEALEIVNKIWSGKELASVPSHTAHLGMICDSDDSPLDQAVATVFRAPNSFTGDDVIEISVHGSKYIQRELINTLIHNGARLAEAGEFTRRAFTSGRLDLAQAEAVADIIASDSRASHRIALTQMRGRYSQRLRQLREQLLTLTSLLELELDFSEEDVEFASRSKLLEIAQQIKDEVNRLAASFRAGNVIKNGIPVAIIGATNAGKSSLLNALLGDDRAIVSDIHGTTRDVVEDTLSIGDYTYRLMDTAGMRDTDDTIERLGIERSRDAANRAKIVLVVIDTSDPKLPEIPHHDGKVVIVLNKTDLTPSSHLPEILSSPTLVGAPTIEISATEGRGIDHLTQAMQKITDAETGDSDTVLVTNARHYQSLINASESITRAIEAIEANLSGDLISLDIRLTITHLNEILGEITSSDILATIFSRFCIGK